MLLPVSWLKKYLPTLPPLNKLTEVLMMHGLEVEQVIDRSRQFHNVVVGEILAIKRHPNADKLQLAEVRTSSKAQPQEIVCGAPNIAVGQKVPVALLGAQLPNGLTIEKRAIRGVESNGMICAEDELGLGKHHAGVLVLDPTLKVGTPFAKAIGLDQPVLDLAIPANRSDLMSVRGLAWEIGAMLAKQPIFPEVSLQENTTKIDVNIAVANPKDCPLYTARAIRGVTIGASPAWMQSWLWAAGMRPINAVVDVTNFVMLLYGQPLHAFDANTVKGDIVVRSAKLQEKLVTLDGEERQLDPSMLVIADSTGPIALAGVKGGQATGVTDTTTDILLESAIFNPVSVRKTSRKLGLVSEASKRYEKGLWPNLTVEASRVAVALIAEFCGGTVDQGSVDVGDHASKPKVVELDPKYIAERLGMKMTPAKAKTVLQRLGFKVSGTSAWKVTVPDWRLDVRLAEDIVDEVGRMVGYEKIPAEMPPKLPVKELPKFIRFQEEVKNILMDLGLTEIVSYAFYGGFAARSLDKHIEVANPLDKTQQYLRKSLRPQMSEVLKREAEAGKDALVFEIGRVFLPEPKGDIADQQPWKLAIGVSKKVGGSRILEEISDHLFKKLEADFKRPEVSELYPSVRGRTIPVCEIDLADLMKVSKSNFGPWKAEQHLHKVQYRKLSKYPPVTRDISFWWSADDSKLQTMLRDFQAEQPLLVSFKVKDTFSKDGQTSYLVSFTYQSLERTLTKAEVDKLEKKIKDVLVQEGATIR